MAPSEASSESTAVATTALQLFGANALPVVPAEAVGEVVWKRGGSGVRQGTPTQVAWPGCPIKKSSGGSTVELISSHTSSDDNVSSGKKSFFEPADNKQLKDRVKKTIERRLDKKQTYNVQDFYRHNGFAQRIAKHPIFDHVTLTVIVLNAAWLWVDTDFNEADTLPEADPVFQVAEHSFCAYFLFEWVVRFLAFEKKANGLQDGWFVFDSILVFLGVMETWVLLVVMAILNKANPLGGQTSILRLFRLLRLSRLLRMLRSLPELMVLAKGMKTALKSVSYVICLLAIITYMFAIAITQLSVGTEMHVTYFDHVSLSMYSLIVHGTFVDSLSDFCNDVRAESPLCLALLFVFIVLAALNLMNMLIGVLCEVVSAVAAYEKQERLTTMVSEKMQDIVNQLDTDTNNMISYDEFKRILDMPEALDALSDVGVDPEGIVDFAELFFFDEGEAVQQSFADFMRMVLDLRSSNHATVKDVQHLWLKTKSETDKINKRLAGIEFQLAEVLEAVRKQ